MPNRRQHRSGDRSSRHVPWLEGGLLLSAVVLMMTLIGQLAGRSPGESHNASIELISTAEAAPMKPAEPQVSFENEILPLLDQYCFDCHGPDRQKADVNFDLFKSRSDVLKHRKLFKRVGDMLYSHEMPPSKKPQPTDAERRKLTGWIESAVMYCDCTGPIDPGRETIQRLNRAEYNNTIRDLIGLDLKPADKFPLDDVGEGFDNMGDVLTISPLLMEKYLAAAESVLGEAIVTQPDAEAKKRRFEAERMSIDGGGRESGEVTVMFSNGKVSATGDVPAQATYKLRARAWAQQAGDQPAKMTLSVDGRAVKTFDVIQPRNKNVVYEVDVELARGSHEFSAAFVNDYYNPKAGDPNRRDRNLMIDYVEVFGPTKIDPKPLIDSHRRIFIAEPTGDGRDAATTIVQRFAERAFRRPVDADEASRYLVLYDQARKDGATFVEGVKQSLLAVMVSPHFLFRIERDRPTDHPKGAYALDDFELASRLSYFLWSSMPDDELLNLARQGRLHESAVLAEQTRRMLKDPKSRALIDNFAGQWLHLRNLNTMQPDPEVFPEYDAELKAAMADEARWFFASIVLEDRSILELIDADFTFVNERLAKHYGISGVTGRDMQRVDLKANTFRGRERGRGGVLTMAAVLTVTSNPTRTNPVLRGKWVLDQLLDDPPPPPPANVPPLEATAADNHDLSLRQRMEQHRADPVCASCHERMDPIGFALENYDAIGRWRDTDNRQPIDAAGVLPDGREFNGSGELKAILLADRDRFARCMTEKMLTFALGRPLEYFDTCAVDAITKKLAADDYHIATLITQIVLSDPFRYRRNAEHDEVTDE